MAWTDPRDWVTNEVVTSALLNTHLRDNLMAILHPFHTENTRITVTNTTNQTSLFTTAPVIPANDMGANGRVRVEMWGTHFDNVGTVDPTFRIKFGGVTHITDVWGGGGGGATPRPWQMLVDIINDGATNSQWISYQVIGRPADIGSDNRAQFTLFGAEFATTGAVDTTINQTLDVSIQWASASASIAWDKYISRVSIAQA